MSSGSKYTDILHYKYDGVKRHIKMSLGSRAAQFAPFSALSGFDEMIEQEAHYTDVRKQLSEDRLSDLDAKIRDILLGLDSETRIEITYFVPDSTASGGAYKSYMGVFWAVDWQNRQILLDKGDIRINAVDISDLKII